MILDENGNPVVITEEDPPSDADLNDVDADPSSADPDPNAPPDEDPSASQPRGRKPGAEDRIRSLIGEKEYWKGRAEAVAASASTSPAPAPDPSAASGDKNLDPNDFDSDAAYLKARADQTEARLTARFEAETGKARQAEDNATIQKSAIKSRKAHKDFDAVALNPAVPTSQTMVDAMRGENYAEILYALGSDIQEATRIFNLSPVQQIKEIGKIEARITTPKSTTTTSAPNPVPTITGVGGSPPAKDMGKMTRSELHSKWGKEREEELRRKYG